MKKLATFVAFILVFGTVNSVFAHKSQIVGDYEIEVGWRDEPPLVGRDNAITIMITKIPEDHEKETTHDGISHIEHMLEEHKQILAEHEQMMQEHNEAMKGNMAKSAVGEMIKRHMSLMKKHEKIMEEHESMHDQMTQKEIDEMISSHKKIRQDHEQMHHDHETLIEIYGIDSEHEDHDISHDAEHEGISGLESAIDSYVTLNGKKTILHFVEDQDVPGLYLAEYTPNQAGYPIVHLAVTINDQTIETDFHPEKVEDHTLMSPRKQQNQGIPPNQVECNMDKVLMSKSSDGSAICVTQSTAEKLLARNWATYF